MPAFFEFQQGRDSHSRPPPGTESLLYGRFRAFSSTPTHRRGLGDLFSGQAYSSFLTTTRTDYGPLDIDDADDRLDEKWRAMLEVWWTRWTLLGLVPALTTVLWCAIPFPTAPLEQDGGGGANSSLPAPPRAHYEPYSGSSVWHAIGDAFRNVFDLSVLWEMLKSWFDNITNTPPPSDANPEPGAGHGASEVAINFWFFLVIYYGFYNLVALYWNTKIFNLYGVNWWSEGRRFASAFTFVNAVPLVVAATLYHFLPGSIITLNFTWIALTFLAMCCPFLNALKVLIIKRWNDQLGVRRRPSESSYLFSSTTALPTRTRRKFPSLAHSYRRFLWFGFALVLTLVATLLGEIYTELYLRTLPHTALQNSAYVMAWVVTIYSLDGLTGWILNAKVDSYPLAFVFKLYFALTYQTYVRGLYARLRSPSQFAYLQLQSSSIGIVLGLLTMSRWWHSTLAALRLNGDPYAVWRKRAGRAFFVKGLAENVSMIAWLGWVLVLHYGNNTKVYPYFSFRDKTDPYTFELTFYASLGTWICEIMAGMIVRRIMRKSFNFNVTAEAVKDFDTHPDLLPACLLVMVHVLQNMLLNIIRLHFYQ